MNDNVYEEIKIQKASFIEKNKKFIELFKQRGYVLNFKFIKSKSKIVLKYNVIAELYPAEYTKGKAIKSNAILIKKSEFLMVSNNKVHIYNNHLDLWFAKKLKKIQKNDEKKLKYNIVTLFIISLIYPDIYKKYYSKDFSVFKIVILIVVVIILAIIEAKYHYDIKRRLFTWYE